MLHPKRLRTIQIRVSDEELKDILKYTEKFSGFSMSTVLRALILGTIYEQDQNLFVIDKLQQPKISEKKAGGSD